MGRRNGGRKESESIPTPEMATLFVCTAMVIDITSLPLLPLRLLVNPIVSQLPITATFFQSTAHGFLKMTTFDVFCTLTIIDMREAERAEAALIGEAKKEADRIANLSFSSGDAAKGAKLFQVSSLLFRTQENKRGSLTCLFPDPLRPVPHR